LKIAQTKKHRFLRILRHWGTFNFWWGKLQRLLVLS
jgi:hypothetical protein